MLFRRAKNIKLPAFLQKPELHGTEKFLDRLIENLPNMVFVKDAKELRFVRFNKAGEDLLGYSRHDLIGKNDYDFFPKEQADFFTDKDRAVLAGNVIVDIPEESIQTKDKGIRILHTRKIPVFGADGKPEYLLGISEDITERKKAEESLLRATREQAALAERELVNRRASFLANASTLLSSSLDYHESLQALAKLAVPFLGDWCTITMLKDGGKYERVAAYHINPSKEVLMNELSSQYPIDSDKTAGITSVINSGKTLFTPFVPDDQIEKAAKDENHLRIMRGLGCTSCIVAPISSRGKIQGAISFVAGESGREYTQGDVAFVEELGRRVGIAIDNALLFESAQKAISARDEFLSIASHELKTPITALKLQLQIAQRNTKPSENITPTPEKLAKMLDVSSVQVNRLTTLIDDLLDVTRIEAGKLSFQFEMLDVSKLINETVDCYSEHFKEFHCPVTIQVDGPVFISADRFRLEQVVLNLLSNAAKYGAGKPIEVSVGVENGRVRISVRDYGIGIPADKYEKIFERFERAISAQNISGLGLGLYITKKIVQAHQGNITVRSELGKGSLFVVELPDAHALHLARTS